ncbi:MAG: metallophosphoesterase [Myxococcales bacterium]|nr:MAG: metallophosphoesterase [Myxococcales bacterium]
MKLNIVLLVFFIAGTSGVADSAGILLFGDFGTGEKDQGLVAEQMIQYCKENGCDFAITTGDNVYPRGIENLKNNEADYNNGKPNFKVAVEKFVKFYGPMKMPFYMSYGNHDVGNEGPISIFKDLFKGESTLKKRTLALMSNEINFTKNSDNPTLTDSMNRSSSLWYFPDAYYSVTEKGNTYLHSINTNTYPHRALSDNNDAINTKSENFEQKKWLEKSLSSNKGWKIVFGHMPLYSHGLHGWLESSSIKNFRNSIIDTLCENKVDFYLSGHDHHLEVDKHLCSNGHVIVSVISGAAAKRGRIYKSSFPIFSSEKNFLWGNGQHYKGDKSIYHSDDDALGFSYVKIVSPTEAKLIMKQTIGNTKLRQDGCFTIEKGKNISATGCL